MQAHFVQVADIDASGTKTLNEGLGFLPIGDASNPFTGSYNGKGYSINNLYIQRASETHVGLFGSLGPTSELEAITLNQAEVSGADYTGILAGHLNGGKIRNSSTSGSVASPDRTGGLVGLAENDALIFRSSSSASVSGPVDASQRLGGLVGFSNTSHLIESFATGTVTGQEILGGLVGLTRNGASIVDSYATGEVVGNTRRAGGLLGYMRDNPSSVTRSYASGKVSAATLTGGLIGERANSGSITNNYWDVETTEQTSGVSNTDDGTTGLTTSQMTGSNAAENMAAFDFTEIWKTTDSYPVLQLKVDDEEVALFAGGSGTPEDPWRVATAEHLNEVRNYRSSFFLQIANIDLTDTGAFIPIGEVRDQSFLGTYDGGGHEISNLIVRLSGTNRGQGLFGFLGETGVIRNLGVVNVDVIGGSGTGALVGQNEGGLVQNCWSTGTVQSEAGGRVNTGGLVGRNTLGARVENSYSTVDVVTTGRRAGGLVGLNENSTISNSYATGSVVAQNTTDTSWSGGLVGENSGDARVIQSWSSATVNAQLVGGLAGASLSTVELSQSYWDAEATGITVAIASGDADVSGVTGLQTAQMQGQAAFENMSGLDFEQVWHLTISYPALQWEDVESLPLPGDDNDVPFPGGSGTPEDPWQVATAEHLNEVRNYRSSFFLQIANIDLTDTGAFIPIGEVRDQSFLGTYDGGGHEISNLIVRLSGTNRGQGLFGFLGETGVIRNLGVVNVDVIGGSGTGALVGQNEGGLVQNCWSTGTVQSEAGGRVNTGGLVGRNTLGARVENSYSTVDVVTTGRRAGGLVGLNENSTISNSYATGSVVAQNTTDTSWSGGLVGENSGDARVIQSWSSATVNAQLVGGLAGASLSTVELSQSYWDAEATGITVAIASGDADVSGVTGLQTAQMQGQAAFENMSGLDFEQVWHLTISYPALQWEDVESLPLPGDDNDVPFPGGSGTENDPWHVANLEQLQAIGDFLEAHFILTSDIDASETSTMNDGHGFMPIGSIDNRFNGSLDGNGFKIANLVINRGPDEGATEYVGLFGVVDSSGVLRNIHLEGINVTGKDYTGSLAGLVHGGLVDNVFVTGVILGQDRTGGIIGLMENGAELVRSYANLNVTAQRRRVGGLVGFNNASIVRQSVSAGSVLAIDDDAAGGLVGLLRFGGIIEDSYSMSSVTSLVRRAGGLVGLMRDDESFITRSFATGEITAPDSPGGLVGLRQQDGQITRSYWDFETTRMILPGGDTPSGLIGLSTSQMTGLNALTNMPALDFESVWVLTENYPALSWEDVDPLIITNLVELASPENGATDVDVNPTLRWFAVEGISSYQVQLSRDIEFSELIVDSVASDTLFSVDIPLVSLTKYFWRVQVADEEKDKIWNEAWSFTTEITTSIEFEVPIEFSLKQNYPNPFNPSTNIEFSIPVYSDVLLEVFNIQGQRVATLVNGSIGAGSHTVSFDASMFGSGVYIYRIQAGEFSKVNKMLLIK